MSSTERRGPVVGVAVAVGGCGAGVVDAGGGDGLDGGVHGRELLTAAPGRMGALQVLGCLCAGGRWVGGAREWCILGVLTVKGVEGIQSTG